MDARNGAHLRWTMRDGVGVEPAKPRTGLGFPAFALGGITLFGESETAARNLGYIERVLAAALQITRELSTEVASSDLIGRFESIGGFQPSKFGEVRSVVISQSDVAFKVCRMRLHKA